MKFVIPQGYWQRILAIFIFVWLSACSGGEESSIQEGTAISAADEGNVVTVYSARAEHLIEPLFDKFTAETGIQVRYITDTEAALIARLQTEQERTPADALLTVDAGNLWHAADVDMLQPLDSEIVEANVPPNLRASDDSWAALSIRARTIAYSTDRVDPAQLSTYEALADDRWQGRLCLRTSDKVYNQSLVASMIASLGEERAEEVVSGWVNNLAVDPMSNDTMTIQAIEAGVCDVAIINTYYFGRLEAENPDIPVALFWPNQDGRGVHINVSGMGITRYAKHPELARQLIEWLSSEEAQRDFAGLNKEYPVNPAVEAVPEVQAWGDFKRDALNVEQLGALQADAIRLMDRAGYR
ncbi:MAG: extracellular solute-binding protein [Porticoccaceae bacterium]